MKLLNNIKASFTKLFGRKPKEASDIWKDSRFVIKHAFTAGGVDYYCFDDLSNTPYERALQSVTFYNELQENCSKDVMKEFHKAIKDVLNKPKIDIFEINKINELLGERLYKLPPAPSLIYRLASVAYFDKSENPTVYDMKYNLQKIKRWQKAFPDGSFFLSQPIKTLIPHLNVSEENLSSYLKVWEELDNMTLDSLLLIK